MLKEEKIRIAFEEIQKDADKRIIYTFCIFLPTLFLIGTIYKQPVLALAGCIVSGSMLYFALVYVGHRKRRNLFITLACMLSVSFLQIVTKGLAESRYAYFVFLYMLVLYRERTPIAVSTVIVMVYIVVAYSIILSDNAFAALAKNYLIETQSVSIEKFVFVLIFTGLCNLVAFMVVDTLYAESMTAIHNQISKEQDLQNYTQNAQFADEIAAGNLDVSYNDTTIDALGKSLINMRSNLKKADEKDEQERFISDTTAEIGEILRTHTQDMDMLTDRVLATLIQKLSATQGAIYLVEGVEDIYLEMVACYAYNRKKYLHQHVQIGEGLIGQTFLEQLPTFVTEIPAQYKAINTGMGQVTPSCLFIVPLKANEQIVGVLEIASLKIFIPHELLFLEKIADDIASTLITARNNRETQQLYQQSQIATEELRTREEEMRQNMEELKTTQEEMLRAQTAVQESQMKSRAIFDGSINSIIIFNEEGWIEEMNPSTESMFGYDRNYVANMKIENLFAEFSDGFQNFIGLRSRITAKKRNGETFPVQSFLNRFMMGSRNIMLIYSRDASKEVARENEAQIKISQLELAKQTADEQIYNLQNRESALKRELETLKNANI